MGETADINLSVDLSGLRLEAILPQLKQAALDGMEEHVRGVVMPDADENCPVLYGTLRSTHFVEREGDNVIGGYGGPAAAYAVVQHERLDFYHNVGEAKWLENAFNRHIGEVEETVGKRVTEVLK